MEYQAVIMIRERDQESGGEASNCCICLFGNGQLHIERNEAIYISDQGGYLSALFCIPPQGYTFTNTPFGVLFAVRKIS